MCLPLVVNPVSCSNVVKPPTLFNCPPLGHHFAQPKTELTPSNGDGWKFFSNVTVQSSAAPDPSVAQDLRTVNLSDLNDFSFSNFSPSAPSQSDSGSRRDGTGANGAGGVAVQEVQNTFVSSIGLIDESEILDFSSFHEAQTPDVENINTDDLQALLGQSGLPGEGPSTSVCHPITAVNMAVDNTLGSNGAEQAARNINNGSWMNYPPSIASFLMNEQMSDPGMTSASATSIGLDETDVLNSMDEDRLMSIFTSGNQVGFLSGHPT